MSKTLPSHGLKVEFSECAFVLDAKDNKKWKLKTALGEGKLKYDSKWIWKREKYKTQEFCFGVNFITIIIR